MEVGVQFRHRQTFKKLFLWCLPLFTLSREVSSLLFPPQMGSRKIKERGRKEEEKEPIFAWILHSITPKVTFSFTYLFILGGEKDSNFPPIFIIDCYSLYVPVLYLRMKGSFRPCLLYVKWMLILRISGQTWIWILTSPQSVLWPPSSPHCPRSHMMTTWQLLDPYWTHHY